MHDFRKPCPHEKTSGSCNSELPDHHPLSQEEVVELLNYMGKTRVVEEWAQAAIRLCQAIPGMVCPTPDTDTTAGKKHLELEQLLADNHKAGVTPEMVAAVMKLIS